MAPVEAAELYETLKESLAWEPAVVRGFGRTHYPNRSVYAMADPDAIPYSFSGSRVVPHPWHAAVASLRTSLEKGLGLWGLNFALLNYYRDGSSSLGYHADDERDMQPGSPIVGVVLGYGRDFLIKAESDVAKSRHEKPIKTFIGPGDVFVMEGATQKHYKHSVPRRVRAGPRISITFRRMKTTD